MKSLKYSFKENAIRSLNSGCNLLLHCNGNLKESSMLCKLVPNVDRFILKNTSKFYKKLG